MVPKIKPIVKVQLKKRPLRRISEDKTSALKNFIIELKKEIPQIHESYKKIDKFNKDYKIDLLHFESALRNQHTSPEVKQNFQKLKFSAQLILQHLGELSNLAKVGKGKDKIILGKLKIIQIENLLSQYAIEKKNLQELLRERY
ncbi:MAG: hypothetical protein WCX82_04330 [archaeon]|jgi:hypothetical protein